MFISVFFGVLAVVSSATVGSCSVIIPSERCTDPSESLNFLHITGDVTSCCDTYELRGRNSNCHFHFYPRQEALNCLAGKHLIILGGSWQFGLGMGYLQLLKPDSYPVDPDAWLNCDTCNLQTTGVGSVTMADVVIDAQGSILSTLSVQEDSLENSFGGISESSAASFIDDKMSNAPFQGPQGVRVTFARVRYYDAVAPIVERIWDNVNHEGQEPLLILGLRGWWYTFCASPPEPYCPRSDQLRGMSSSNMPPLVSSHLSTMFSRLPQILPEAKTILINGDKQNQHEWLDTLIRENIDAQPQGGVFQYVVESGTKFPTNGGAAVLHQDNHPNNKQNQMLVARTLNTICEDGGEQGDIAIAERITFLTKGCTVESGRSDNWARHFYQPCQWESTLYFADDTKRDPTQSPTTQSPTLSPTTIAPTSFPTDAPTRADCRDIGVVCAIAGQCCSNHCSNTDSGEQQGLCSRPPTSLPTQSPSATPTVTDAPTLFPTQSPTVTDAPTAGESLSVSVQLPQGWTVQDASTLSFISEMETSVDQLAGRPVLTWTGVDDGEFRIALAVLSCIILSFWLFRSWFPETYQALRSNYCGTGTAGNSEEAHEASSRQIDTLVRDRNSSSSPTTTTNSRCVIHSQTRSGEYEMQTLQEANRNSSPARASNPQPKPPRDTVAAKKGGVQLNAFGMARYVASVHIVAGHLIRKDGDVILRWHTSNFGYTWVPWFMMLSGFILTWSRVASKNPDKLDAWHVFTAKRLKSIYPLYISALFARAGMIAFQNGEPFTLGNPLETFTSLFLLQSWIPTVTETVFQEHCWFLSCIVPYWMLHNSMYRGLRAMATRSLLGLIATLSILPWFFIVLVPYIVGDLHWYTRHLWQSVRLPEDIGVIMLKYHPFAYLHIYAYGMIIAIIYFRCKLSPPFLIRWGATIGYLGLYGIFAMAPFATITPAADLSCRLGVLAPLQGLSLVGLAAGVDPLAKLFAFGPLSIFGDVSYPQYLFQFIAHHLWGTDVPTGLGFWLVLVAMSVVGFYAIQKPLRPWKNVSLFSHVCGGVSMILIPLVLIGLLALRIGPQYSANVQVPSVIRYSDSSVDVEIPFQSFVSALNQAEQQLPNLPGTETGDHGTQVSFINPSLLWFPETNSMLVLARRHLYLQSTREGFISYNETCLITTVFDASWHSDIVVANVTWNGAHSSTALLSEPLIETVQPVVEMNQSTSYCETMVRYHPENNTATTLSRFGPEDPRVFRQNSGKISLTFNRLPKLEREPETSMYLASQHQCDTEVRMSLADLSTFQNNDFRRLNTDSSSLPRSMSLEHEFINTQANPIAKDKNWMALEHPSYGTFFIRSLHPFTLSLVVENSNGVAIGLRDVYFGIYSRFEVTSEMMQAQNNTIEFHGGSNAVFVSKTIRRDPYYLATFHTVDSSSQYTNYFVEFDSEPPFAIRRVSQPIPLVRVPKPGSSPMTFASGLAVAKDPKTELFQAIVTYGSSDQQSRMLRLSAFDVEDLFQGQSLPTKKPTTQPTKITPTPTLSPTRSPYIIPTSTPTKTPAMLPTQSPVFPTSAPSGTDLAGQRGEPCSHPDDPNPEKPECVEGLACVRGPGDWTKCVLCRNPEFNWDCIYWSSTFLANAEAECEIKCTSTQAPSQLPT